MSNNLTLLTSVPSISILVGLIFFIIKYFFADELGDDELDDRRLIKETILVSLITGISLYARGEVIKRNSGVSYSSIPIENFTDRALGIPEF